MGRLEPRANYHKHMKTAIKLADALARIVFGPHNIRTQSSNVHCHNGILDPLNVGDRISRADSDGHMAVVLPWVVAYLQGLIDVVAGGEIQSPLLKNFHHALDALEAIYCRHALRIESFRQASLRHLAVAAAATAAAAAAAGPGIAPAAPITAVGGVTPAAADVASVELSMFITELIGSLLFGGFGIEIPAPQPAKAPVLVTDDIGPQTRWQLSNLADLDGSATLVAAVGGDTGAGPAPSLANPTGGGGGGGGGGDGSGDALATGATGATGAPTPGEIADGLHDVRNRSVRTIDHFFEYMVEFSTYEESVPLASAIRKMVKVRRSQEAPSTPSRRIPHQQFLKAAKRQRQTPKQIDDPNKHAFALNDIANMVHQSLTAQGKADIQLKVEAQFAEALGVLRKRREHRVAGEITDEAEPLKRMEAKVKTMASSANGWISVWVEQVKATICLLRAPQQVRVPEDQKELEKVEMKASEAEDLTKKFLTQWHGHLLELLRLRWEEALKEPALGPGLPHDSSLHDSSMPGSGATRRPSRDSANRDPPTPGSDKPFVEEVLQSAISMCLRKPFDVASTVEVVVTLSLDQDLRVNAVPDVLLHSVELVKHLLSAAPELPPADCARVTSAVLSLWQRLCGTPSGSVTSSVTSASRQHLLLQLIDPRWVAAVLGPPAVGPTASTDAASSAAVLGPVRDLLVAAVRTGLLHPTAFDAYAVTLLGAVVLPSGRRGELLGFLLDCVVRMQAALREIEMLSHSDLVRETTAHDRLHFSRLLASIHRSCGAHAACVAVKAGAAMALQEACHVRIP